MLLKLRSRCQHSHRHTATAFNQQKDIQQLKPTQTVCACVFNYNRPSQSPQPTMLDDDVKRSSLTTTPTQPSAAQRTRNMVEEGARRYSPSSFEISLPAEPTTYANVTLTNIESHHKTPANSPRNTNPTANSAQNADRKVELNQHSQRLSTHHRHKLNGRFVSALLPRLSPTLSTSVAMSAWWAEFPHAQGARQPSASSPTQNLNEATV